MKTETFGQSKSGSAVTLFTCTNTNGLVLKLIDYGAIVVAMETPDRSGNLMNINFGFPTLEGYLQRHPYFGATVGRFCNRIAGGKFTLEGKTYQLATNNGPNHLHGGVQGFDAKMWKGEPIETSHSVGVRFTLSSPDGDEGYPGHVTAVATYQLNNANELTVDLEATTDKATPINLTNHNYWNLAGVGHGNILDHVLTLAADKYLPVDSTSIPTGELADVAGTPMDFREPHIIGARIAQTGGNPRGYDHCYVIRGAANNQLKLAAHVKHPGTGRVLEIHTTQPGVQFYSGNYLDGQPASGGFEKHGGFCLETQHFPDSPNRPEFPTTILKPGEKFRQTTVHKFSAE
ncbi:MAG: galactose mutarotase [Planctomycetota bacterium]|nr:galactose mutarotase [Planctomycetota bacterium]MDA1178584.1 galactose mutarotase [Planctomycetota bacterium]